MCNRFHISPSSHTQYATGWNARSRINQNIIRPKVIVINFQIEIRHGFSADKRKQKYSNLSANPFIVCMRVCRRHSLNMRYCHRIIVANTWTIFWRRRDTVSLLGGRSAGSHTLSDVYKSTIARAHTHVVIRFVTSGRGVFGAWHLMSLFGHELLNT